MWGVVLMLDVFVDGRVRVDVVDLDVEPAVVIEIGICRAVRKARLVYSPFFGLIGERQITVVPKDIVGQPVAAQVLEESQRPLMVSGSARSECRRLVIEIIGRFGIAVGDEDVLVSVVVEVAKQGT